MAKELTYEEAMEKLETIVKELEGNELTLDQSIQKFEEGIKLSKHCEGLLCNAEKKISILLEKEDGTSEMENFDVPKE